MTDDRKRSEEQPNTALEEVLAEVEEAERRTTETDRQRRRRGEAGEAITPNTGAQEQSSGDD
ncbi:hypothetical protein [Streptomyces sp. DH24]|uniref:hypothetical protein n=1 Tax=Streptomyces sp. DH24 TaxID=3040123 RepID=UPI00244269C5|nr:hypothetical protein [Streptomyces sp. DH24]MDG9719477.1 hypothetical protein [Streptomyces sp. DH24]